ncbi:MAG: hypothetical protein AAGA93_27850 [Actinomycetota bacterium]
MSDDPVTVAVGYDRFTFDLILAKATDAGLRVWPLQNDNNGLAPGLTALAQHKILVDRRDAAQLRAIVAEISLAPSDEPTEPRSGLARLVHRLLTSIRL